MRTSKKKLKAKKQEAKKWLHDNMHSPIGETMKRIQLSLKGHCNYYGVSGNFYKIQNFWKYVQYTCYRTLNRRHQKRSMKWDDFYRIWDFYVEKPHLTKDIWNRQPKLV